MATAPTTASMLTVPTRITSLCIVHLISCMLALFPQFSASIYTSLLAACLFILESGRFTTSSASAACGSTNGPASRLDNVRFSYL